MWLHNNTGTTWLNIEPGARYWRSKVISKQRQGWYTIGSGEAARPVRCLDLCDLCHIILLFCEFQVSLLVATCRALSQS